MKLIEEKGVYQDMIPPKDIREEFKDEDDFLRYASALLYSYHKHSFIFDLNRNKFSHNIHRTKLFDIDVKKSTIKLYGFDNWNDDSKKYIKDINQFLINNPNDYLIIDLRENRGGQTWSMIRAFSLYLDNSSLFKWIGRENDQRWISLVDGHFIFTKKYLKGKKIPIKIAILVGRNTASAGEILATCFMERKNCEIFGSKTKGLLTVNGTYKIKNYIVAITETIQICRDGSSEEYIKPKLKLKDVKDFINPK